MCQVENNFVHYSAKIENKIVQFLPTWFEELLGLEKG